LDPDNKILSLLNIESLIWILPLPSLSQFLNVTTGVGKLVNKIVGGPMSQHYASDPPTVDSPRAVAPASAAKMFDRNASAEGVVLSVV